MILYNIFHALKRHLDKFSAGEHSPLRYPCFASEFSQSDAVCVSGLNLFPSLVGDLSAQKGLDNLIDACPLVQFKCFGSDGIAGATLGIAPEITFLIGGWQMNPMMRAREKETKNTNPKKEGK